MGPGAVKGEQRGLSPLAVQHANQSGALSAMGKATVWRQAAQMLEEKLNG